MSKRQIRLSSPKEIISKLSEISGKKVNIVLKSGAVIFVKVTGADKSQLQFTNMRQKHSSLDIDQISEVIIDVNP